jgi:hypothetical protein
VSATCVGEGIIVGEGVMVDVAVPCGIDVDLGVALAGRLQAESINIKTSIKLVARGSLFM